MGCPMGSPFHLFEAIMFDITRLGLQVHKLCSFAARSSTARSDPVGSAGSITVFFVMVDGWISGGTYWGNMTWWFDLTYITNYIYRLLNMIYLSWLYVLCYSFLDGILPLQSPPRAHHGKWGVPSAVIKRGWKIPELNGAFNWKIIFNIYIINGGFFAMFHYRRV